MASKAERDAMTPEQLAAYRAELFRKSIEGREEEFLAAIPKTQEEWDALPSMDEMFEKAFAKHGLPYPPPGGRRFDQADNDTSPRSEGDS